MTISSKDGLIAQEHFFNKLVSSKDLSGYYLLKKGEFAYNKSYSVGYDFGSIKRLELYEKGALSTLYICFSVKYFRPEYIRYYFDSLKWYKEIYLVAAEGARNHGLLNVPTESFFETKHLLSTNLMEQAKIANFLSLIDQRIEKQRQLVESLKKYKRGLFKYVFDILSDAPFYPLKDIAELIKGTQLSKINMIKNGKFYVLNGGIIPSGRTNSYNTIANIISISEGGNSCGYVNYNTQPFWSGGHCYTLQNISDFMNERFLWHYLKFQEKNIMMLRIGSGLPNIQKASLLKFLVLVPELKVQNKYAMIFDKIENFENAQFEILKNLNLLKQSLLQQMFI